MDCARSTAAANDSAAAAADLRDANAGHCTGGPSAAELEVRRALAALAALAGRDERGADVVAREAVRAWVRRLRDHRQLPPERALVAVKRAARSALAPALAAPAGARTHEDAEARLADVVRWCIEEYYR